MLRLDTLRPDGALRWKTEDRLLGRSGSVMRKVGTSKVVPPSVSVKDRGVATDEQVLNVPIACRRYELGKTSSRPSTEGWLYPHCLNGYLGRETGYRPTDQSAGVLWVLLGAIFSGAVALLNSVVDCVKGFYVLIM
jgi:hypothetical protein